MISGDQIRDARKRAGYSQSTLAELVGVVTRTVGGWERGETAPGLAEPRLLAVLRDHLDDVGEPPLRAVSDVELLAEIARRFSRTQQRKAGDDGGDTAATKAPGSGPVPGSNVTELRPDPFGEDLDALPDERDDPPPIRGRSTGRAARTEDPEQ